MWQAPPPQAFGLNEEKSDHFMEEYPGQTITTPGAL